MSWKQVLRAVLDGELVCAQDFDALRLQAPDAQLWQAASRMRSRYRAAAVLLVFSADEEHRLRAAIDEGYGCVRCPADIPIPSGVERLPTEQSSPESLAELLETSCAEWVPQSTGLRVLTGCDDPGCISGNRRALALLRLMYPADELVLATRRPLERLNWLTVASGLMLGPDAAAQTPAGLFSDLGYGLIKCNLVPVLGRLRPALTPAQLGRLEAESVLWLRRMAQLVADEDTRVDLTRSCNRLLFTQVPRFPDGFAAALQRIDDGAPVEPLACPAS